MDMNKSWNTNNGATGRMLMVRYCLLPLNTFMNIAWYEIRIHYGTDADREALAAYKTWFAKKHKEYPSCELLQLMHESRVFEDSHFDALPIISRGPSKDNAIKSTHNDRTKVCMEMMLLMKEISSIYKISLGDMLRKTGRLLPNQWKCLHETETAGARDEYCTGNRKYGMLCCSARTHEFQDVYQMLQARKRVCIRNDE